MSFVCPRCGNSDPRYIGYKNGKPYCRACISFQGKSVKEDYQVKDNIKLSLTYPLSEKQEKISIDVLNCIKEGKDCMIHAITGAGKTELVYKSMQYALSNKLHVGFTVPRKDVVIDLAPRIKEAFPIADVTSVYGGHSTLLEGDIILLTTHQLYRYEKYFDLLIFDEIDAFPYKGNLTLLSMFINSVKGNFIMLSATPNSEDIDFIKNRNGKIFTLYERYHHKKIPVPEFIKVNKINGFYTVLKLLKQLLNENKPVFVFTPTINEGEKLYRYLSIFLDKGEFVSSKEAERSLNIDRFKNSQLDYLVTTSILERGVTVKDLQVIVYDANSDIYDKNALIQIAGRVGRKTGAEDGKVYFIGEEENESINQSIREIDRYNRLSNLL